MVSTIFYVEFKMGKLIGPDYPFLKFWLQWTKLKEYYEEQERRMKRK